MSAQLAAPQNLEAEVSVLGAVLLTDGALPGVLETGLRPEHFYRESHGTLFQAMLELRDRGSGIDPLTLKEHLRTTGRLAGLGGGDEERGAALVESVAGFVPTVSQFRDYAQIVVQKAADRIDRSAAYMLVEGIDNGDQEMRQLAMSLLAAPKTDRVASTSTAEQMATRAFERYQQTTTDLELFPLPAIGGRTASGDDRLNEMLAGGCRRGEYTGVGGHTSHGKSVFVDQWLDVQARRGHESRLYLTEATEDERLDRIISRMSGVPLATIRWRRWKDRDRTAALRALEEFARLPFSITSAQDWTADEIRLHIEFSAVDAVAIDTLHDVARPPEMGEEPGLRYISSQFRAAAKSKGRERALVVVVHLNDTRNDRDYPPEPVNRDVRGSGMIVRHLDTLVMVWRKPDADGEPAEEGIVRVTKSRHGEVGRVNSCFNGSRVRWMPLYGDGSPA